MEQRGFAYLKMSIHSNNFERKIDYIILITILLVYKNIFTSELLE